MWVVVVFEIEIVIEYVVYWWYCCVDVGLLVVGWVENVEVGVCGDEFYD